MGLVLDIGSGHRPRPFANVLMDSSLFSDYERGGHIKRLGKPLVIGDIEAIPFKDHSFDTALCYHVLEHVNSPARAIREIQRIARRGHIECPSDLNELIDPQRPYHKWYVRNEGGVLLFQRKPPQTDSGAGLLGPLAKNNLLMKIFMRTNRDLLFVNYKWEVEIKWKIVESGLGDIGTLAGYKLMASKHTGIFNIALEISRAALERSLNFPRNIVSRLNKADLNEIICCPCCKGNLEMSKEHCTCTSCSSVYEVYGDVPILLPHRE